VTRRHTLGRKLTFVDVTCPGPGPGPGPGPVAGSPARAPAAAPGAAPGERSPPVADDVRRGGDGGAHHHVFLKCWGAVDRLARPGAVVRFRGRMLRETNRRDRDARSALPGSYDVSVPEGLCEVRTPAGASDVANAAPALIRRREAAAEADAAANASASPSRRRFRPPIETTSARGSVDGLGSRVGRVAVARLCKSMLVAGACGDPTCAKRHDASPAELASASRARAAARRRAAAARTRDFDANDPHALETKAGKRLSDRIFADWIVETFGLPSADARAADASDAATLNDDGRAFVVGDVAGGGGALSRELHVRHGLSVLMVDPRQVRSSPRVMRETRGLRKEAARGGEGTAAWRRWRRAEAFRDVARDEEARRLENHYRRVLKNTDEGAEEEVNASEGGEEGASDPKSRTIETFVGQPSPPTEKSAVFSDETGDPSDPFFKHVEGWFWDDPRRDGARLTAELLACDVLVGMHPDQATEPIVDFCLRSGKPFAVVPCCVFPELFPGRVVRDGDAGDEEEGREVREYGEFVRYLAQKHPDAKIAYLPFQGRNRVVYRT